MCFFTKFCQFSKIHYFFLHIDLVCPPARSALVSILYYSTYALERKIQIADSAETQSLAAGEIAEYRRECLILYR